MIKYYYWDSVRTFRNSCVLLEADTIYPNIMALDHVESIKEMPNLKETLNSINCMSNFNTKDLNWVGLLHKLFVSIDMDQINLSP